jgi:hypothetical protein
MGYRLLGIAVWKALKFLAKRWVRSTETADRVKLAGGLAFVVGVFVFVLSRKEGEDA